MDYISKILEILKIILPAINAGICTFLVTKYSYDQNVPLEKFEIAYNRVYYPIYCITKDHCNDHKLVIEKSEQYFLKYKKYVDRSTLHAFNNMKEYENTDLSSKEELRAFNKFKDNIHDKNSYLRKKLGYLEPNIFILCAYNTLAQNQLIRIFLEIFIVYIIVAITSITHILFNTFNYWFLLFALIIVIIALWEIICYNLHKRKNNKVL